MRAQRVLFMLIAACGSSTDGPPARATTPELTAERLPPAFGGILPGASQTDVLAKFPSAGVTSTMVFNGHPSDEMKLEDPRITLSSTPRGKDGKVFSLKLIADDACEWVSGTVAMLPGSEDCGGGLVRRKTGDLGRSLYYCMQVDGRRVNVECDRDAPLAMRDDGTTPPPADVLQIRTPLPVVQ